MMVVLPVSAWIAFAEARSGGEPRQRLPATLRHLTPSPRKISIVVVTAGILASVPSHSGFSNGRCCKELAGTAH